MSFPAYREYKDSGIEWLGRVPDHWEVYKLGYAAKLQGGYAFPASDFGSDGVTVVRMNNLKRGTLDLDEVAKISPTSCLDKVELSAGDLLWGMSGSTGETGSLGNYARVRTEDMPCQLNQRVGRFLVNESLLDLGFLEQLIQTSCFYEQVLLAVTGTAQFNISSEQVEACTLALPPLDEQNAIASFLDVETSKIDALVSEQRRLIELLKEKRQAVISHAVTKGLNPNAPMKPSGIQWLGDVPEHWEIFRMGVLYADSAENGNDDLPVLQVSIHHGVSDRELAEEESDRKITRIEDKSKYKRVVPNDLVYNMMRAWQGGFGTVKVEGMVSPAYVVGRPKKDFHTQFIEHLFRTPQAIEQMRRYSHGVTDFRLRLYWDKFKNLRVAFPDKDEQEAICEHIEQVTSRFDALCAEAERAIELLQERRTALISAAVTGKIDVRELAYQEMV